MATSDTEAAPEKSIQALNSAVQALRNSVQGLRTCIQGQSGPNPLLALLNPQANVIHVPDANQSVTPTTVTSGLAKSTLKPFLKAQNELRTTLKQLNDQVSRLNIPDPDQINPITRTILDADNALWAFVFPEPLPSREQPKRREYNQPSMRNPDDMGDVPPDCDNVDWQFGLPNFVPDDYYPNFPSEGDHYTDMASYPAGFMGAQSGAQLGAQWPTNQINPIAWEFIPQDAEPDSNGMGIDGFGDPHAAERRENLRPSTSYTGPLIVSTPVVGDIPSDSDSDAASRTTTNLERPPEPLDTPAVPPQDDNCGMQTTPEAAGVHHDHRRLGHPGSLYISISDMPPIAPAPAKIISLASMDTFTKPQIGNAIWKKFRIHSDERVNMASTRKTTEDESRLLVRGPGTRIQGVLGFSARGFSEWWGWWENVIVTAGAEDPEMRGAGGAGVEEVCVGFEWVEWLSRTVWGVL